MSHFIGMKLIKIWHFQFSDFEIEKPENCQIVKSLFNWSARIRADYCCHCSGHGPANGAADDFSFLSPWLWAERERGPKRVSCYYSTRGKITKTPLSLVSPRVLTSGHPMSLVTRCLFSTRQRPSLCHTLGQEVWHELHSDVTCNTDPLQPPHVICLAH